MGAAASIAPPETAELASTARALDALPEASRASWAKIRHLPVEDQVETVLLKLDRARAAESTVAVAVRLV